MSFRGDRRGVTVQVGAVLLLGILVLLLATYQTTVVPQQNERVEFQHSQAVQEDVLNLRGAMLETAERPGFRTVSIQMGTQYPERALFVNPPPPSGTIQTSDAGEMGVENVNATNAETRDYLYGTQNYATKHVSYSASYSVYQNAPRTAVQSGVVVNDFERGRSVALSEQPLVRGNQITLVAVEGNLSQSQVQALDVEPRSLSTSRTSTTVRSTGDGLNVTVPTTLSEDAWRSLLDDELDPAADPNNDRYVTSVTRTGDAVRIQLEANRTYRLRTALVGVGRGGEPPQPAYVTNVTERNTSLARGTPLVTEVRDHYNNPVDPTTYPDDVTVNVTEGRDLIAENRTTVDEDGRAQVTYTGGEGQVTLKVERLNGPESEVSFNVTERSAQGSDDGDGDTGATSQIRLRVDDLTQRRGNSPRFVVSYDTQNVNSSFERIEIDFQRTDGTQDQVRESQNQRGSFVFEPGNGQGDDYSITARLYYSDGQGEYVRDARTLIDTADAQNPSRNDDLSENDSPVLDTGSEISDQTNAQSNKVSYRFDYTVTTNNNFQKVTLGVLNLYGNGASRTRDIASADEPNAFVPDQGNMDGANTEYRTVILVYDSEGVVVDIFEWRDTADGQGSDSPP